MIPSRYLAVSLICGLTFGGVGCTEPGETTGIGAATGGAIGAGLGAIIGSQTGSPGGGLAVGAAAGAATGAAIGNVLEAQEEAIQRHDEAIARQDETIKAQKQEIEDLRSLGQDKITFRDGTKIPKLTDVPVRFVDEIEGNRNFIAAPMARMNDSFAVTRRSQPKIAEANLVTSNDDSMDGAKQDYSAYKFSGAVADSRADVPAENIVGSDSIKPKFSETDLSAPIAAVPGALNADEQTGQTDSSPILLTKTGSAECEQGLAEIQKGQSAADPSDKLFHFRRALRVCPNEPAFHNGLGEIYRSLNRNSDAEFEFKQALRLNPEFSVAQQNLEALNKPVRY